MNLLSLIGQGDGLTQGVAWLLLAMSIASWVVILFKAWLLGRAARGLPDAIAAAWQSQAYAGAAMAPTVDPLGLVGPLLQARTRALAAPAALRDAELLRGLRGALDAAQRRLRLGQTLLATVGATAPFVGLLGTVWGIYHALTSLTAGGAMSIDRLAGPVGEALVMTAAGLGVAIPAVLAYNVMGRVIADRMAELEGLAHDMHALPPAAAVESPR